MIQIPLEEVANKKFMEFEHQRIIAACSLTEDQYEASDPPIYAAILAEGRTKVAVKTMLNLHLRLDITSDNPVLIYVSLELVWDVKELKFGLGWDIAYQTCHHGLSPFAVPCTSWLQQCELWDVAEALELTSSMMMADVLVAKNTLLPSSYKGLLQMLKAYVTLLTTLCGEQCLHLTDVKDMHQVL